MWKILKAQIREKIYYSLISRRIFHDEQKACSRETRGKRKLLNFDKHILNKNETDKSSYGLD